VFLNDPHQILLHEQDYIIIQDPQREINPLLLAQITKLTQEKDNELKGEALILGEFAEDNFKLSPCRVPFSLDSVIKYPPKGLVSQIISYHKPDGIYLGDIVTSPSTTDPFLISPQFFERHVLCVASTGAGKSYSIGVLLEEILLKFKSAAVLLFDVHNEYWGLAQKNVGDEISSLSYEGYTPQEFSEQVLIFEKESLGLGTHFDLSRLRRLLDLSPAQENVLINLLSKPEKLDEILLKLKEADIHSGTRENLLLKINALKRQLLYTKDLDFHSMIQPGQVSIVRLDQYNDEAMRTLVVNEILTQLFEQKIQGKIANDQEIIIVLEEAHRFALRSDILIQLAREGRKFGIYEILISQRPGDLTGDIIANMNTLIALRIKSDKDLTKIRLMEGITSETVSVLPHLTRGEALIVGLQTGLSTPIKVRVRPRLTKHVNPQFDKMPEWLRRYSFSDRTGEVILKEKTDSVSPSINSDSNETDFTKQLVEREIKPFDYKDLANILSCEHVLILHKLTGICLYQYSISMLKIDPQLVSGFLTAITSLFTELKDELVKDRTISREFTEEIGDRAFKIIMIEGKYSATAMVLERPPKYKKRLKKRIRNFVYAFEDHFQSYIAEFLGNLDPFLKGISLLDRFLGMSLVGPVTLDINAVETNLYPHLLEIIKEQSEQLASSEGLYTKEILHHCLLDSDYSYLEIITSLIDLFREKILMPIDSNRRLPSFTIHREEKQEKGLEKVLENDIEQDIAIDKKNLEKLDIEWIEKLLSEIQENQLPEELKEDILVRNLIFESNVKLKGNTTKNEVVTEDELKNIIEKFVKFGFSLEKKTINPLSGVTVVLSSNNNSIIISIATYGENDFICVIGELE
jgi:DNA helicase HerA-like ATPase